MSDRDPRPMPTEVLRAYRDPVDLRGLLMSSVYSEQDRRDVLQSLTRSLIARYGDVWIVAGSKEVRVSTRVKQIKKKAVNAIDLLAGIDEYGGGDGVLPLLAKAMEPMWLLWWESFEWREPSDVSDWLGSTENVLGQRQIVWLAAQYARTVIDVVWPRNRVAALRVIEAAEAWARVPSEANLKVAASAVEAARAAYIERYYNDAYAAFNAAVYAASTTAFSASDATSNSAAYATAITAANVAASDTYADNAAEAYGRLAALTKSLITPTLVTSASGAVHSTRRR